MITGLTPLPGYSLYQPSAVEDTGTQDALLPTVAVNLSEQADVVATLGGARSSTQVYTSSGILNSIVDAGTLPEPPVVPSEGTDTQNLAQEAQDAAIATTLATAATPAQSGVYTGAGLLQSLPSAPSGPGWSGILKARPGQSATAVSDYYSAGVVNTLDTYA